MPNTYHPDRWVMLEFNDDSTYEKWCKILAGWRGSFTDADSWKLSSRVIAIHNRIENFEFQNESGSIYKCYKHNEGFTLLTCSIYESIMNQTEGKFSIRIVNSGEL